MSVRFVALSGTTGVTENFYVYEYLSDGVNVTDSIIVDCGVGFPDAEMFGVDLVIPDFDYIKKNIAKIRGILVSHGHEDHLGALPFLFSETSLKVDVYATKLVAGFVEDKLADYKIKGVKIQVFNPEEDVLHVGPFSIHPFRISHSVPDAVGFAIDTPEGRLFHIPDYKFDWTPVDGRPFDVGKVARLSSDVPVLGLASDSLGSTSEGYTKSEKEIEARFEQIIRLAEKRVYLTTISSNISRMQQAINVAAKVGRKVVLVGRSIEKKAQIAKKLGYLHFEDGLIIPGTTATRLKENQVLYIISGCYGQPGSALYRASLGEHQFVHIKENDMVIFSADPAPPGSKTNVDFVVDRLFELGVDVHYYDTQEDLHVSGHGSMEDIKMLFAIVRPRYFIPIGGTVRHMQAYKKIAVEMGAKPEQVFQLVAGDIVEYKNGSGKKNGHISVREVMVDGLGIGDVGEIVLRDRHHLSQEGIVIVVLQIDTKNKKIVANPEIISRGFVFKAAQGELIEEASEGLYKKLSEIASSDARMLKNETANFLDHFFFAKIGRRPMVLPVVVEV